MATKKPNPRDVNPIARANARSRWVTRAGVVELASGPQWIYLANPVPQTVANRAAALLKTPGLHVGMAWIENAGVDCTTTSAGVMSQMLRYTCENHGGGKIGISVYGLV